jgi:PPK2 family polyphosphate:nucleotide phosphotransferase
MHEPVASPYLVPFDGTFRLAQAPTRPPKDAPDKSALKDRLAELNEELDELQRILYAHDHHAVLLVFQAMDAAGKDGTIRAVMRSVNPAGCQVYSFKQPSAEELEHDFLWRTARALPERGRIGIFNRSYYEEVLIVRVHPELLEHQKLPARALSLPELWAERYESIREHERHLARSGTAVLKFFLHVSREEQADRFLARLDAPHKNWKFELSDVRERGHWDAYMSAYEDALNATSRPWAPWYAIPADSKPYQRVVVAELVVATLKGLGLKFPDVDEKFRARFDEMRALLESEKR